MSQEASSPQTRFDVFVSHSKHDKLVADAVCHTLEANGLRCWIAPRDVTPGESWPKEIIKGIDAAKTFVVIFSSHANDSPEVAKEVHQAFNKRKVVFPFRIEDIQPSDELSYHLDSVHWLDAFTPPVEEQMNILAHSVKRMLGGDVRHAQPAQPHKRPVLNPIQSATKATPSEATNETKRLEKAKQMVRNPALAMILAACLGLALNLFGIYLANVENFKVARELESIMVLTSPLAILVFIASVGMLNLRWYWFCVLGGFAVMLAGLLIGLAGIPIGVWVIQTLRIPGIRLAFQQNADRLQKELSATGLEGV